MDKPVGITSHDAVDQVRRRLGIRQVGHTGTLDPFATGLLVVLVGRATRLARFVEGQPKTYLATARLGTRTDTDDLTGTVLTQVSHPTALSENEVRSALAGFIGVQPQRPPSYSAKRVEGERSYRLARRGAQVAPADVIITVYGIELLAYRFPDVSFRAIVSAGTYMRAIGRDLGDRLGLGAHLISLRREAIGSLVVGDAVALDSVGPGDLLPASQVLRHLPVLELDPETRRAVAHGRPIPGDCGGADHAALVHQGELVAVAKADAGWLRPTVVLEAT
ncbi:MAG TPA: tRNA pseudouridine(55) synthase TruB [Gemmatimonadales bacterium]